MVGGLPRDFSVKCLFCTFKFVQWQAAWEGRGHVLVICLRTFFQCPPGNVSSAPCVSAWRRPWPVLSRESMDPGSGGSCAGSQSAPAGLQKKMTINISKKVHAGALVSALLCRSSYLPGQPPWWPSGPAPPWFHCCTAPPMSLGPQTHQPELENASGWAPQSQSRTSHYWTARQNDRQDVYWTEEHSGRWQPTEIIR